MRRFVAWSGTIAAALLASRVAWSQPQSATPGAPPGPPASPVAQPVAQPAPDAAPVAPAPGLPDATVPTESAAAPPLVDLEQAPPPPTNVVYLQYGVAFTAEAIAAAGPICDNTAVPCILGPGGGIAVRVGWRSAGRVYLGGAYELSKQDPNKLYRLALLQQARFEGRYYFPTGRVTEPYVAVGAGVAGYGNEWAVDTWGPAGSVGGGLEVQISRRTVVGAALAYRLLWMHGFTDTSGAARDAGVAQLFGFDLVLEQRDPIFTRADATNPSRAEKP